MSQELVSILQSDSFKQQISMALPSHLTSDRLCRIALTELRKTPTLSNCDKMSFLGAIVQSAQLGLEPGNALGHAYLIPYKKDCNLIIGYRGLLDLARRSGQIVSISAHVVHENDEFKFQYGLNEELYHVPTQGEKGEMIGAYAVAHLVGGGHAIEVMWKGEIDRIKAQSQAARSSYSPWNTHYDEMARKTVIRRICKYLPISVEMHRAVSIDESADYGKQSFDLDPEMFEEIKDDKEIKTGTDKILDALKQKE